MGKLYSVCTEVLFIIMNHDSGFANVFFAKTLIEHTPINQIWYKDVLCIYVPYIRIGLSIWAFFAKRKRKKNQQILTVSCC